jgi:hypothetical protein
MESQCEQNLAATNSKLKYRVDILQGEAQRSHYYKWLTCSHDCTENSPPQC